MGEYDGMDYTWAQHQYECEQNFKKQQRWDPDHDGYIEYNGKKFRSEEELNAFLEEEKIKNLISCGMSVPEIRNWLSNPKWNPTEKQIELMKLAKEAQDAERKRLGDWFSSSDDFMVDDEYLDFEDPRIAQPENVSEFKKVVKKPGNYEVKMNDGLVHEIAVYDRECYVDYGVKDQKKRRKHAKLNNQGARKAAVSAVPETSLVVIDGSNVVGVDECLRVKVLVAMVKALKQSKYQCKVFVDKTIFGWLRKSQDDEGLRYLSEGEKQGEIIVAPNKAEADGQILQLAEFEGNVHVITNDRYRDYVEMHPWLADRSAGNRLHGVNLVRVNDKVRVLIAGFNLDIVV